MIPDEEEHDPYIDFTWFYFIGRVKLHLSAKEIGRLTLSTFNKLYAHYKNDWDMEMRLTAAHMTYSEAFNKAQEAEEWF